MSHATRVREFVVSNRCSIKRVPFEKLNDSNLEFVFNFMEENKHLSDQEFKGKAHYLFIDSENRPKNHIAIIEVLMTMCSCS